MSGKEVDLILIGTGGSITVTGFFAIICFTGLYYKVSGPGSRDSATAMIGGFSILGGLLSLFITTTFGILPFFTGVGLYVICR